MPKPEYETPVTLPGLLANTQRYEYPANDPKRELSQWLTPTWAAEAIIDRYFRDLDERDNVIDACCGAGAFLGAIPITVPARGIEKDPILAEMARKNTGRPVQVGDFRTINIDVRPTAIISNPPYHVDFIHEMLNRAFHLLPDDANGRIGCLLPAFFLQTAGRVARLADRWSIRAEQLPRNIFPGLSVPLTFVLFSKDRERILVGLALYREADEVLSLPKNVQETLRNAPRSAWLRAVIQAVQTLGGTATIEQIYRHVEGRVPTRTRFVREQVRKQCQLHLRRVAEATYTIPADLAA